MLTPIAPPQAVPIFSGFDYVTVDPRRRRVYAAHGGSRALLVVDADSGKVVGQVRVGPMHGVAVDEADGHVFTADADGHVREVDPSTLEVLRTATVAAHLDAMVYDPATRRLYADEDDGTRLFVFDRDTLRLVKTIALPGHKPEYLAVNPRDRDVYQNVDDLHEIAVIDPVSLAVVRTIATPELRDNHPLQYDPALNEIVVAGANGVMSAYAPSGRKLGQLAVGRFDQCDLDRTRHVLACAGSGEIARFRLVRGAAPQPLDATKVDPGVHTVAIDRATGRVWTVWSRRDGSGDFVQGFAPAGR